VSLPTGWAEIKFSEGIEITRGVSFSKEQRREIPSLEYVQCLRSGNVQDHLTVENPIYVPRSALKSAAQYIRAGDSIVSMSNSYELVGKVARAMTNQSGLAFGAFLAAFRSSIFDKDYLFYLLRSPSMQDAMRETASQTVNISNISISGLATISLLVPPLQEQRRIIARLDALTARLTRMRTELARIPLLAKRLRQQALTSALRGHWGGDAAFDGWSNAERGELSDRRRAYLTARRGSRLRTDIPEQIDFLTNERSGWLDCRLADVISLRLGYAFKSGDFVKTGGTPLLRGANIAPGNVDWADKVALRPGLDEAYAAYRLSEGDIVIAMDRPVISSGLKIARLDKNDAGSLLVQRVANPRPSEWILPDYLMAVLQSDIFMRQIEDHSTGSDLPHISGNDILTTPCPLPPIRVQKLIAHYVCSAFAHADRLEAEAERATHLVDRLEAAILAKAFRGELDRQNPTDEPAATLLARIRQTREAAPKSKRGRDKVPA